MYLTYCNSWASKERTAWQLCYALTHTALRFYSVWCSHTALRGRSLSPSLCAAFGRPVDWKNTRRRSAACCAACLPVKLAVTRARQVRCSCSVATTTASASAVVLLLLQLRGFFFVFVCLFCLVWCRFNAWFIFFFASLSIFFFVHFGLCVECAALPLCLTLSFVLSLGPASSLPESSLCFAATACCAPVLSLEYRISISMRFYYCRRFYTDSNSSAVSSAASWQAAAISIFMVEFWFSFVHLKLFTYLLYRWRFLPPLSLTHSLSSSLGVVVVVIVSSWLACVHLPSPHQFTTTTTNTYKHMHTLSWWCWCSGKGGGCIGACCVQLDFIIYHI